MTFNFLHLADIGKKYVKFRNTHSYEKQKEKEKREITPSFCGCMPCGILVPWDQGFSPGCSSESVWVLNTELPGSSRNIHSWIEYSWFSLFWSYIYKKSFFLITQKFSFQNKKRKCYAHSSFNVTNQNEEEQKLVIFKLLGLLVLNQSQKIFKTCCIVLEIH